MLTLHLKGQVTSDGQLLFELPQQLPPGVVDITIEIPNADEQFTPAEIKELLRFTPTSGADVVAAGLVGGWEHKNITDPVAWVEEQRRKQREQREWQKRLLRPVSSLICCVTIRQLLLGISSKPNPYLV